MTTPNLDPYTVGYWAKVFGLSLAEALNDKEIRDAITGGPSGAIKEFLKGQCKATKELQAESPTIADRLEALRGKLKEVGTMTKCDGECPCDERQT
jgi:hypothetical protein